MSADGAHQGVSADRAIKTILGGEPAPTEDEGMDPATMLDWIRTATPGPWDYGYEHDGPPTAGQVDAYGECARYAAKLILDWILADPRRMQTPSEADYDWDADPDRGAQGMKPEHVRSIGWYEQMKADGIPIDDLDLTGFMWGWAVNAVRYVTEQPPVPNPAIVEINPDTA